MCVRQYRIQSFVNDFLSKPFLDVSNAGFFQDRVDLRFTLYDSMKRQVWRGEIDRTCMSPLCVWRLLLLSVTPFGRSIRNHRCSMILFMLMRCVGFFSMILCSRSFKSAEMTGREGIINGAFTILWRQEDR